MNTKAAWPNYKTLHNLVAAGNVLFRKGLTGLDVVGVVSLDSGGDGLGVSY